MVSRRLLVLVLPGSLRGARRPPPTERRMGSRGVSRHLALTMPIAWSCGAISRLPIGGKGSRCFRCPRASGGHKMDYHPVPSLCGKRVGAPTEPLSSAKTPSGGTTCRYGPWPRSGVSGAAAWTPGIGIE
jgi:hypothetical protein